MKAKGEVLESSRVTSAFYCPALLKYMLRVIMPLTPLWSQLLSKTRTSNAAVESYMRIIKKQLLRGRTRLHPCDFVRQLLNDTAIRVKLDVVPARRAPRGKKRTRDVSPLLNPEQQEEFWAKRDPTASRPTWYARTSPPSCMSGTIGASAPGRRGPTDTVIEDEPSVSSTGMKEQRSATGKLGLASTTTGDQQSAIGRPGFMATDMGGQSPAIRRQGIPVPDMGEEPTAFGRQSNGTDSRGRQSATEGQGKTDSSSGGRQSAADNSTEGGSL